MLELVAEGLENKEIAHRIGISESAVKEQRVSALLRPLAVRNRAALAEIATELKVPGMIERATDRAPHARHSRRTVRARKVAGLWKP